MWVLNTYLLAGEERKEKKQEKREERKVSPP